MILYLDTSALVKIYVEEEHSDSVRGWVDEAEIVAACRVAYPEAVSALNRRFRNGHMSRAAYNTLAASLARDWSRIASVDFDEMEAGRFAAKHALRGFDAVHLSSAKLLAGSRGEVALAFSSFDERLNRAAAKEGLVVLSPGK